MNNSELMEDLAHIEHERWSSWQRHLMGKCEINADGTATIPAWAVSNWTRQMNTPYAALSESEKESDRREVRVYLKALIGKPFQLQAELAILSGKF